MKPRFLLTAVAALLALGHAPAAGAQDTALVDAAASALTATVARMGPKHRLDVEAGATAFDSAVAKRLGAMPAATLPPPLPGHRDWVAVDGVTFAGDTADVRVRFGTSEPPSDKLINMYIETRRYRFIRDASGWRFLSDEFLSGADYGPVRG